jgi:adenylosuccinate synthase
MPISVVVGGQFGSEGKGKVAHFLAVETRARFAVRVGGPNSGHTVIDPLGNAVVFRHLPTASLLCDVISVIPSGAYLHVPTLLSEIKHVGLNSDRLVIDPHAWVIEDRDVQSESEAGLQVAIGSTGTGTGAALIRRIHRVEPGSFAKDVHQLQPYIRETSDMLAQALSAQQRVLIEGTQGFGLSLLHSKLYPYCTSRDTVAAAFVAEAGLSPLDVDQIVLVIRSFPIRVAGVSGPLPQEIDWDTITLESGYSTALNEYTSVTKRLRRVARFDAEVVRRAIAYNHPTHIALNHLDYIDAACARDNQATGRALDFVRQVEHDIGTSISLLGLSPASLVWRELKRRQFSAIA